MYSSSSKSLWGENPSIRGILLRWRNWVSGAVRNSGVVYFEKDPGNTHSVLFYWSCRLLPFSYLPMNWTWHRSLYGETVSIISRGKLQLCPSSHLSSLSARFCQVSSSKKRLIARVTLHSIIWFSPTILKSLRYFMQLSIQCIIYNTTCKDFGGKKLLNYHNFERCMVLAWCSGMRLYKIQILWSQNFGTAWVQ